MRKNYLPVLIMSLLIAVLLSGGRNKPEENSQGESEPVQEPLTKKPSAGSGTGESQPRFDVEQDVLLSCEYDSNGKLSKVTFMYDPGTATGVNKMSIKSSYNTGGQIISLTIMRPSYGIIGELEYNYEIVYNDDGIKVHITN